MNSDRKTSQEDQPNRFEGQDRQRVDDALHAAPDADNLEALKEAARLGGGDTYLVKTDLEDADQRSDEDQPDGRAGPMSNADNPER
jgi:hypothetical protein